MTGSWLVRLVNCAQWKHYSPRPLAAGEMHGRLGRGGAFDPPQRVLVPSP